MGRGDLARRRDKNDRRRKHKERLKRQAEERGEARRARSSAPAPAEG